MPTETPVAEHRPLRATYDPYYAGPAYYPPPVAYAPAVVCAPPVPYGYAPPVDYDNVPAPGPGVVVVNPDVATTAVID